MVLELLSTQRGGITNWPNMNSWRCSIFAAGFFQNGTCTLCYMSTLYLTCKNRNIKFNHLDTWRIRPLTVCRIKLRFLESDSLWSPSLISVTVTSSLSSCLHTSKDTLYGTSRSFIPWISLTGQRIPIWSTSSCWRPSSTTFQLNI